jgi:hypothetical protein
LFVVRGKASRKPLPNSPPRKTRKQHSSWAGGRGRRIARLGLHRDAQPRVAEELLQEDHHREAEQDDPDELRRDGKAVEFNTVLGEQARMAQWLRSPNQERDILQNKGDAPNERRW